MSLKTLNQCPDNSETFGMDVAVEPYNPRDSIAESQS